MKIILTGVSLLLALSGLCQSKKKIDQSAYNEWKTLRNVTQSASGAWVFYEVAIMEGDANLVVESIQDGTKSYFPRGKNVSFLKNETIVVFMIEPEFDTIRKLKLAETSKDKFPKDTLAIHWLGTDSVLKIPLVKSYQVNEDNGWIAYLSTTDKRENSPKKQSKRKKKKNACIRPATSGFTLTVFDPEHNISKEIHCVTSYLINENGSSISYIKSNKGDKDTLSLYVMNLTNFTEIKLLDYQFGITQMKFDESGNQFAFLSSNDTNDLKNYNLYLSDLNLKTTEKIIDSTSSGMPLDWTVSEFGRVFFSENGSKLYFGTNKIVRQLAEESLLASEKSKVDVWGSNDLRIQPVQLIEQSNDEKKSFLAVYHLTNKSFVQVSNNEIENVRTNNKGDSNFALGIDETLYQREATWEYPWKSDFYIVDLTTGSATLLKAGLGFTGTLSPSGNYFVYYNAVDSNWYSISTDQKTETNLTKNINAEFATDNNGTPALADEVGFEAWVIKNDQEYFLVNTVYDLWSIHVSIPEKSYCLTQEKGVKEKIKFDYYRLDYDSVYSNLENNLIVGVNDLTKAETIYTIDSTKEMTALLTTNHRISYISKAEESDQVIMRRMSFTDYPDLEKTNMKFENPIKFTDANTQQANYNWGTVEMVSWKTYSGLSLRGLVYKPEDFDSTKTYPMIVYFYEKYTDDIHVYYSPKPTASIIFPTEYVSNGYIVFIPDIEYTPGYPAKSAYDCIVSGTESLIRKHNWIDSTRMGLQGQSWGGYQTAQLITMTTKFKAAMAGAPVTNMTSAYGGIRWGSGYSRMFQYEHGQSRIGYTLWERPDLYMQNSPMFALPNVRTPLLIMSNDGDGAVPWYQGIEMYMGLRRLNQPVWLLNYNGDEHNLIMLANKKDLSIRMRQFFDYYLLGMPMPMWMSEGVPAIDKGTNFGLELEKTSN